MNKNAIKNFAVKARRELIARVAQKATEYGISENNIVYVDPKLKKLNGKLLSSEQINQRNALIAQIEDKGYEQVMEEVAYTWFNRFIALRFMEVNNYLPSRVRVFTDEENKFNPQIITEAIHLELDGLDMDKVYDLKQADKTDELYRYLLITQCNALNKILPKMFQKIADYTELLFPDNLLREGSVIDQMLSQIPEDDWKDAVQIIGWLYQYYNAEKKDEVFANLKKNIKITKENIPAATQLFTPDWIVRYMVENSLGRLWVEGHPNDDLKANWKYYLEEAEQEPEVKEQLAKIRKEYAAINPEQIKCIDPCCGSGHILVYMFDVLVQIYESYGYNTREAVEYIIKNNIYGLDIDERAAQLAYFAVMMKARQYDNRFLKRKDENGDIIVPQPQIYSPGKYEDAKEYGSILIIDELEEKPELKENEQQSLYELSYEDKLNIWNYKRLLTQKYDVVCTNPPYMGASGMGAKLSDYVKKHYPDSKSDLFAVLMESCGQMAKKNGYQAMITQHAWMFLSSFEKLRTKLLQKDTVNMAHLGARAFEEIGGEVVQTTSFVMRKSRLPNYRGTYCRLIEPTTQQGKEDMFLSEVNRHCVQQENFLKIPTSPFAYWVSENIFKALSGTLASDFANFCKGMDTGNNDKFLRLWFEVNHSKFTYPHKWVPYNKGGSFRKWFGNNEYVVNWEDDGSEVSAFKGSNIRNKAMYLKPGVTWSATSSSSFACRYCFGNAIFDSKGCMAFSCSKEKDLYLMAAMNAKPFSEFMKVASPTLDYNPGPVSRGAVVMAKDISFVSDISNQCILLSKQDWDSFENSWDFTAHPLIRPVSTVAEAYTQWATECNDRFVQLKDNEEELNRIFIDIYGLQDELTPEVEDKDVTVRKADLQRDIKSLISYAVGCMFGRYSPLKDGLLYAGGAWDYTAIQQELMDGIGRNEFSSGDIVWDTNFIDKDNILPICDDEYFEDDIVGRFINFISAVYGKDTLDENLKFIADALGGKGQPKEVIRNYFLNDFYADHCKIYQKRPIYWLFDSGKKNGFKGLIYMHRYQPDTIARIRTDYVHEQQARYRTAIDGLEKRIASATTSERVKLNKELKKLTEQDTELRTYEEKIHHLADQMISIDLDDGVKVNYAKFQDVLAKIK